jgi:galactose mutarotase-like enzyme
MQITLRRGALTAAAETHGGELVSLWDGQGAEYIWDGDPAYWTGRNPILFPIVGALKNGTVEINGSRYEMARHGFARQKEFSLAAQGEDFVELELREDPETLARYPFPFSLRVRHQLLENGFSTRFTVTNPGTAPMPFCIGAHTAFRCPLGAGEAFEDYQLVFDQAEDICAMTPGPDGCLLHDSREAVLPHTDTIPLDHAVYDRVDTLIFDGLRSGSVKLVHRTSGRGVRVEFSQFPMLAFWTKPNARAPYLCIEPWQGCAALDNESGRFTDKPHCLILQPGEAKTLGYTVTVLA